MNNSAPQYQPPPPDPGLAILAQQNQQQQGLAIQDRVSAESARLMTMYGARVATGGNTNWSPLVSAAPPQAVGGRPSPIMASGSY